jgi:hypothetical protein
MDYTGSRQRKSGPLEPLTPSRGFKSVPDTTKPTTPDENTNAAIINAVNTGVRVGIHTLRVSHPDAPFISLIRKHATPFPPKVTTEADAIPGEDDLRSRWVTVAVVDDTD